MRKAPARDSRRESANSSEQRSTATKRCFDELLALLAKRILQEVKRTHAEHLPSAVAFRNSDLPRCGFHALAHGTSIMRHCAPASLAR